MAILVDEKSKIIVQGITESEGSVRSKLMKDYGTNVVAGIVTGANAGEGVEVDHGVPVFVSVEEAWERTGPIDISVIFVPAGMVKNAALEAIEAGVKLVVIVPDRVPIYDVLEISRRAQEKGAHFIGPNTLGLISPGKALLGMIGGRADNAREWFHPGSIGVTSRSGGMTSAISYYLTQAGFGQSTTIHVGGDAIVGLSHPEVLALFQQDEVTKIVVMFGEIGSTQEERAADLVEQKRFTKPLIAYIGGKAAKSGARFSHAGAIIEGTRGSYINKVKRLKEVGVHVVDAISDIPQMAKKLLS
jgi:succinyl-CoA synthetase alpha subunit